MTAPLVFAFVETAAVGSFFSPCAAEKANRSAAHRIRSSSSQPPHGNNAPVSDVAALNLIQNSLLESLHQGVIVTPRSLNPLYWNAKARLLCQQLAGSEVPPLELPAIVSEVCHRLMRDDRLGDRPLVMECQTTTGQTIRISARWLNLTADRNNAVSKHGLPNAEGGIHTADRGAQRQAYILILLENCDDLLQEELRLERKKYDLTDREAEVWMLLRQEYSYQEIAKMLQISLNTVKTHVKNVYAKKRSCQGREKFWCGE